MFDIFDEFNDVSEQATFENADIQKHKVCIVLPYILPFLFFLPLIADKNSNVCKFHANQQFTWFIFSVVIWLVTKILGFIPILGFIANILIGIAILAIDIILMVNSSAGKAIRLPFIGSLFNLF